MSPQVTPEKPMSSSMEKSVDDYIMRRSRGNLLVNDFDQFEKRALENFQVFFFSQCEKNKRIENFPIGRR